MNNTELRLQQNRSFVYTLLQPIHKNAFFSSLLESISFLFHMIFYPCAHQAPVVQRLDNAIYRINHYPTDSVVCFVNTYPLDSDLSGG